MGRDEPKSRRAHLFGVIQKMTAEGSQGASSLQEGASSLQEGASSLQEGASSLQGRNADIAHLCAIGGLSRASYYRSLEPNATLRDDADLRDLIQRLALRRRFEGYRRIAWRLRREGLTVNAKRVLRLMREDNLLSLRARPFAPATTRSRHGVPVVANLARRLKPTAPDQLWVADITYVRLEQAFIYLAVIVDAFSRRVVGWAISDRLKAELATEALDEALGARDPPPGFIHHSDRGVQYACDDYAARLTARGCRMSMSRPGNPYDNAKAESFLKTLKAEEVDGKRYRDLADARARIGAFIDEIYNVDRLHSALGYQSPVEFEDAFREAQTPKPKTETALSPN